MKKVLYKIINKLGYRIEKKRPKEFFYPELKKYKVVNNFELLFNSKIYIKQLDSTFDNFHLEEQKEGFLVRFLDYKIFVESIEEFFILTEVFVNKDYNFSSNHKTTVIDIGANIGISSLFFSAMKCVDEIYAFEPVIDTYIQAKQNFELNKTLHKVVSIKNIGLGNYNRIETVLFNKHSKGNVGVRGTLSPSYNTNNSHEERELKIVEATKEIKQIIDSSEGKRIMIKMDCEGAEYEIFRNLSESKLLHEIDIVIVEWHDKGYEIIESTLLKFGFNVFSRGLDSITGLIIGVK